MKKYPAKRIKLYGVYRVSMYFGNKGRFLEAAYPTFSQANGHVAEKKLGGMYSNDDFMIEELPAIIKSWKVA